MSRYPVGLVLSITWLLLCLGIAGAMTLGWRPIVVGVLVLYLLALVVVFESERHGH